ncbi:MAG: BamA/TamA family outer membrane protein [Bacteroidota bacterium]
MKKTLLLSLILFFLSYGLSKAQHKASIVYRFANRPDSTESSVQKNFPGFKKEVDKKILSLHRAGFVSSVADTIFEQKDSTYYAEVFVSDAFRQVKIKSLVQSKEIPVPSFYPSFSKSLSPESFFKLENEILRYWENNAYPFCSISLRDIQTNGSEITGSLMIEHNRRICIDSIVIQGKAKIHPTFVYKFIGIKPGSIYNERKVKQLPGRLSGLPFLLQSAPPQVFFTPKYTRLKLFLEPKKANQFDGILGFLPDNRTGKVLFTGQLHIKLQNALGRGEGLELEWRKLQALTQDLKFNGQYPYILGTPFGADYSFSLFKRDTAFLEVKNNLGLQYLFSGGNSVKFFYHVKSVRMLSLAATASLSTLPENADVNVISYGAGWNIDHTDYRFNPRKGFRSQGMVSIGFRELRKNPAIPEMLYENLRLKNIQNNITFSSEWYVPIQKRLTFLFSMRGAYMTQENLFFNELFRLGGFQSFRGFDDESIFASTYGYANTELRYLSGKNSNLFLFYTHGYLQNLSRNVRLFDRPYSFGAGINFETKAGVFNLTYAVGRQLNNPLLLRAAKIHFGIISVF